MFKPFSKTTLNLYFITSSLFAKTFVSRFYIIAILDSYYLRTIRIAIHKSISIEAYLVVSKVFNIIFILRLIPLSIILIITSISFSSFVATTTSIATSASTRV